MSVLDLLLDRRRASAPAQQLGELSEGFDASAHPRDFLGQWKKKVGGLKDGEAAHLPDGVHVKKVGRSYEVHARGHAGDVGARSAATRREEAGKVALRGTSATPENAAVLAAQASAQSDHPKSLGGTTKYRSAKAWQEAGPGDGLPAPGHSGGGKQHVGRKVRIGETDYKGEVVGWDGSENYRVKLDRGAREDPALAGPQKTVVKHHSELRAIDESKKGTAKGTAPGAAPTEKPPSARDASDRDHGRAMKALDPLKVGDSATWGELTITRKPDAVGKARFDIRGRGVPTGGHADSVTASEAIAWMLAKGRATARPQRSNSPRS